MLQLVSLLFGLAVSVSPAPAVSSYIPLSDWQAQAGDRFIADTAENIGYLVHEDGSYTTMGIGSGKRQEVRYIGRSYYAATPESVWTVKSTSTFGDTGTFGKTGRFLRLYRDGTEYTSYGIHATGNIDDILASEDRYKSMGCILVSDRVLDILYETYALNGNNIDVVTTEGINENLLPVEARM